MDLHPDSKALRVFLESDEGDKEIDLTKVDPQKFFKNDLIRYRLSGTIPAQPDFRIVNFIGCVLHDISADGVNFSECDFKDTLIKGAIFSNCDFNGGTFATSFFSQSEFRRCTFYNLAAYSCDFHQVHFIDCDLTNLLIKSSRFSQCSFQNCVTSNKICEMSNLFDMTFVGTPIQIDTITNNFGLIMGNLDNSPIRSGRIRESYHLLEIGELKALLKSRNLSALERLALEYFLDGILLNGSLLLDESLDITRWARIYRNPGSFVELLDKFAEFLVHLFDDNKLTVHPILLLHHITSTLTTSIVSGEKFHRVAMSLGGVHLILSRLVEDYLYILDLISQRANGSAAFLVDGPTDHNYFQTLLAPWIENEGVEIARLERNSPLFLELTGSDAMSLLPLLAAFLATRTKLEITRLKTTLEKDKKLKARKHRSKEPKSKRNLPQLSQKSPQPLFLVNTGWVTTPVPAYELRVRSLMPGSLLVDLKLNFSTTLVSRLRSVLLTLLTDSRNKPS
jgi:uncharacterized protein YjbI with pentapeptide repeats